MTKVPRTKDYERNYNRVVIPDHPCAICGKGIKVGNEAGWLYVSDDGEMLPPIRVAYALSNGSDAGDPDERIHPIGRECRRNHPELSEYLIV